MQLNFYYTSNKPVSSTTKSKRNFLHAVSIAEQMDLNIIQVVVSYASGTPVSITGCLDKLIVIREQWLNPFIELARYAGGVQGLTTPILSTDMILSPIFTSDPTVCVSNQAAASNGQSMIQFFLQPVENFLISPSGSLLVSSIFY